MVLDGTGLQRFGQGEWDPEKHRRRPRPWRKLDIALDAAIGQIMAHSLPNDRPADIAPTEMLLAAVEGRIARGQADWIEIVRMWVVESLAGRIPWYRPGLH